MLCGGLPCAMPLCGTSSNSAVICSRSMTHGSAAKPGHLVQMRQDRAGGTRIGRLSISGIVRPEGGHAPDSSMVSSWIG